MEDLKQLELQKEYIADAAIRGDVSAQKHLTYIKNKIKTEKSRMYQAQLTNLGLIASIMFMTMIWSNISS